MEIRIKISEKAIKTITNVVFAIKAITNVVLAIKVIVSVALAIIAFFH